MVSALLFDLDGTLTDSDPLHFRAWQRTLARHGIGLDQAAYHARISGRLNPDIIADFFPGLAGSGADAVAEAKEAVFRELAVELLPIPGAAELLEAAGRAGVPAALVSNAPHANAVHVLGALGVERHFRHVVLAEQVGRGKPWPDAYLHALALLGVEGRASLAFEDSPSGVRAAVAAGIPVVGIASGHDPRVLQEAGAVLVTSDFRDVRLGALTGLAWS